MMAGADLRRAVALLDPDLLALTRRVVLEARARESGGSQPDLYPYLGDWYEAHGHDVPADIARSGWAVSALRRFLEETTGTRPVFTELYAEVTR